MTRTKQPLNNKKEKYNLLIAALRFLVYSRICGVYKTPQEGKNIKLAEAGTKTNEGANT